MSFTSPPDERWIPVAFGALDARGIPTLAAEADVLAVPIVPGPALCLVGDGATLWRELVGNAPRTPREFTPEENVVLEHLRDRGLVVLGRTHPAAVTHLDPPALSSPLHELVYALVQRVAASLGIRCVFVKGPALHHQGLREREHSGDVDVWCDPARWDELAAALAPWGWEREPDPWRGTSVHHTATMTPTSWGCEIDIHRRFPGLTLDDSEAFEAVFATTTHVRYAGVAVAVPTTDAHAVLAAVHVVRPEIGAGPRSETTSASAKNLLAAADDPLRHARDLGAIAVLRDELSIITGRRVHVPKDAVPRDWAWRGRPDRLRAYWTALQTLPLSARLRVARRLLWPDDDVALASERRAGVAITSASSARRRRLTRAARAWVRSRFHGSRRPSDE
ncbi:nucleotidyltransferase family protein [Microbacterium sp. S1037]|uniref:nucleotidyltransferase family protein n=1 Tax=Microbacterium sp. S1037 TaxID=3398227 RepID=UPI003AB0A59D